MSIEELAFKDRKILANLNTIDLLDIIEFLQEDRNQWINQFTKTHNESVEIQKENQELKSQLVGTTHCFDEQEHRKLKKQLHEASLTIQEMVEQDIECPSNCEKLRQLKKQLEEYKKLGFKHLQDKNNILETQQKAFIKFLEDEIQSFEVVSDLLFNSNREMKVYKEILQKYKEITGVSDENNIK